VADYSSVNGVDDDNITSVNGVAAASIESINGVDSGGASPTEATLWVAGMEDAFAAFADADDLTSWTVYDARATEAEPNYWRVAFGKDGSGDPLWVGTWLADNAEVCYTSDPTDSNPWQGVKFAIDGGNLRNRKFALEWGNNVWVAIGAQGGGIQNYFRSTDGQNWTQVDISGLTDIDTNTIYALTTDGAGTWWFGQQCRIYKSTDNAATFSLHHTLTGCGEIDDMCFTNDTLVLLCNTSLYTAAVSDTTDFSSATTFTTGGIRVAAAAGRVVFIGNNLYAKYADVSGKTITTDNTSGIALPTDGSNSNAGCIGTDGTTWLVGRDDGDICKSTDSGATWTTVVTGLGTPNMDVIDIKPDVLTPL